MPYIDIDQFQTPPFPEELPTIDLPQVSLKKLLDGDEAEAERVFDICTRTGFFYLNMLDDPKGVKLFENACRAQQIGREVLPSMTVEEKKSYKKRPRVGVLDMGYNCAVADEEGQPKYLETFNIPGNEMFAKQDTGFQLPPWLAPYEDDFRAAMIEGNNIANIIFTILERQLKLEKGTLTSLHRLNDASNDFLRVLRYPGLKPGKKHDQASFPPHRDAVSIAILFTWIGGLQIPKLNPDYEAPDKETEESWRWVKPIYGHAIVNLGDAISILTKDVLKSGKHRVVSPYGEQASMDRYSVLLSARLADQTPMRAVKSPLIPEDAPEMVPEYMTSQQWGDHRVKKFYVDNNRGTGGETVRQ